SSRQFVEPTKLAVNSQGEILVGDNGAGILFLLHPAGKVKLKIPSTRAAELQKVREEQRNSASGQSTSAETRECEGATGGTALGPADLEPSSMASTSAPSTTLDGSLP